MLYEGKPNSAAMGNAVKGSISQHV